jgi:hypothetical protein
MTDKNFGTLKSSPGAGGAWVTFKDGKHQIRAALKRAKVTPIGTFRPRSANRGELLIPVEGGTITARRKPGAEIVFTRAIIKQVSELSPAELKAILEMG